MGVGPGQAVRSTGRTALCTGRPHAGAGKQTVIPTQTGLAYPVL